MNKLATYKTCKGDMGFEMFLFIGLIASLPFFSLRSWSGGVGLPLFFCTATILVVCFKVIQKLKIKAVFNIFDLLVFVYLLIALSTFMHDAIQPSAYWALLKSIFYFSFYLAVKVLLASRSNELIERALLIGVYIGAGLFFLLVVYVFYISNLYDNLFNDFSYYGITFNVFSTLAMMFGSGEEIISADIMRNAIGEVFAFYFIVILIARMRSNWMKSIYLLVNLLLVVGMFSRRAFFAVVATVFVWLLNRRNMLKVFLTLLFFIGLIRFIDVFNFSLNSGGRLLDFTDPSRMAQYKKVLDLMLSQQSITGLGYGYELDGTKYIHNFILSGFIMMGVAGGVVSIAISLLIGWRYFEGVAGKSNTKYSLMLIMPILGMMIGSTVEGMFTLVAWVVLAIYGAFSSNSKEVCD